MLVISFKVIDSTAFKKCSTGFLQHNIEKHDSKYLNQYAEDKTHGEKKSKFEKTK